MTGGGTEGADSDGDASSINAGTVDQAVGVPPGHGGGDVTPSDGGSHEERGIGGGGRSNADVDVDVSASATFGNHPRLHIWLAPPEA